MEKQTTGQIVTRVSYINIIGNLILSSFKLFAGIVANSGAMISDGVHSASDVFSTVIVIIGVRIASKESDKEHPYGHERMECVAAIILAGILCATGIGIGYAGIIKIISGHYGDMSVPGILALIAALISIIAKEAMYWYTRAGAKRVNSSALMADAWHHRSDALSSVGSFAGILGSRLGIPVLDPVASVVISLFIIKASFDIFKDAIGKMTDTACDDIVVEEIRAITTEQEGVLGIEQIKTRLFGDKIYVDIEISANGNETLQETHDIALKIHDSIEAQFPKVKHCMIYVNPIVQRSNLEKDTPAR